MIDPGLDGKVAVVTGANHGIGAAAAGALGAEAGRTVEVPVAKTTYVRTQDTWKVY